MEIDTGLDKSLGLHSIVEYLRNEKGQNALHLLEKIRKQKLKSFMRTHTLKEASAHGFLPIDCVAENITWKELRGYYSVKNILDWGMNFDVALQMGLQASNIGGNEGLSVLKEMGANNKDIKGFLTKWHDIVEAKWDPQKCKEAGFTFQELIKLGANSSSMAQNRDNKWNIKTIVLAFDPTAEEWLNAGFNDKCVHQWNSTNYRNFVASKTSLIIPAKTMENKLEKEEPNYIQTNNGIINGQPKFVALNI